MNQRNAHHSAITRLAATLIVASFVMTALAIVAQNASAATWSSPVTVYSASNIKYFDGDIAKGANYIYAFADQYTSPSTVSVKRSTDGIIWSSPTSIWSGLNYPHGGFCVYTNGATDGIICSAFENVKRSDDNGATYTALTSMPRALDYTGVATNASMKPSEPVDDDIYVAGNKMRENDGIFLFKSVDGGSSWSQLYRVTDNVGYDTEACCPVLMRNDTKLFCMYAEGPYWSQDAPRDVYIKNSTDWGKTWGSATKVFTHTMFLSYPGTAQYLDEQRCLLTIADYGLISKTPLNIDFSKSRGVYGYLWYGNNTFQEVGCETGASYNGADLSYAGLVTNETQGTNYTSLWCYCVDSNNYVIKTHYTHDSGISIAGVNITPIEPPATQPGSGDTAVDSDLDGLSDDQEISNGTDPYNWDTDGDLLSDGFENMVSGTDPEMNDTDADGVDDFTDFIQSNGYSGQVRTLPSGWVEMTITWQNRTIIIQTNSSVIEGKFDKDKAKLTVKVHGISGTMGAADIWIPKTMCNLSDIKVQFDGGTIDYDVSVGDVYYTIHVTYHHSEHELSAQFLEGGTVEEPLLPYYIVIIVIATVAAVMGATIVVLIRRNRITGKK